MTSLRPRLVRRLLGAVAASALLTAMVQGTTAHAQTMNDRLAQRGQGAKSRLAVDAREIVYNRTRTRLRREAMSSCTTTTASRGGSGHLRPRDEAGLCRGKCAPEGAERPDHLQRSVRAYRRFPGRVHRFVARRLSGQPAHQRGARRADDGETTVFDKGTYTACLPCKDNPERPPLCRSRPRGSSPRIPSR